MTLYARDSAATVANVKVVVEPRQRTARVTWDVVGPRDVRLDVGGEVTAAPGKRGRVSPGSFSRRVEARRLIRNLYDGTTARAFTVCCRVCRGLGLFEGIAQPSST